MGAKRFCVTSGIYEVFLKRSGVSSKNIFRSHSSDRLSSININLIFSYLKNERGVRGEFHFSKFFMLGMLILGAFCRRNKHDTPNNSGKIPAKTKA